MVKDYGRICFIITRSDSMELTQKGTELNQIRAAYQDGNKLIIKLTAQFLASMLSKLRSPQKHDEPNTKLNGLLDKYRRNYLEPGWQPKKRKHQVR